MLPQEETRELNHTASDRNTQDFSLSLACAVPLNVPIYFFFLFSCWIIISNLCVSSGTVPKARNRNNILGQITNAGKGVEKRACPIHCDEDVYWCNHYGKNSMEVPQETNNRVAMWSSNATPCHLLDKTIIQKDTCTAMFVAATFSIAKTWKQSKCSLTDEWIKKMWNLYAVEYYSAIKSTIMHL